MYNDFCASEQEPGGSPVLTFVDLHRRTRQTGLYTFELSLSRARVNVRVCVCVCTSIEAKNEARHTKREKREKESTERDRDGKRREEISTCAVHVDVLVAMLPDPQACDPHPRSYVHLFTKA